MTNAKQHLLPRFSTFVTFTAAVFIPLIGMSIAFSPPPAGGSGTPVELAYVANSSGKSVTVINTSTDTVVAQINGFHDPNAIAIAPGGLTAYVVNGGNNSVTPINLLTDRAEAAIIGGGLDGPVAITITPDGTTAYVLNSPNGGPGLFSDTVTPINLSTNTAAGPITVPGLWGANSIAIAPNGQTAYVTSVPGNVNNMTSSVIPIDLTTGQPGTPITGGGINNPGLIAITSDGTTGWVEGLGDGLTSIDLATGQVGPTITGGSLPFGGLVWPGALALSPDDQTAYVALSNNTVAPVDLATATPGPAISGGGLNTPEGIAVSPDGGTAFVTNLNGASVTPINLTNDTAGSPIVGGGLAGPKGIAIGQAPVVPTKLHLTLSPNLGTLAAQTPITANVTLKFKQPPSFGSISPAGDSVEIQYAGTVLCSGVLAFTATGYGTTTYSASCQFTVGAGGMAVGTDQIMAAFNPSANDPDYETSSAIANLHVEKVSQTITFGALANLTLAQSPVTVSATASSGLPVTFSTTTTGVCTAGGVNGTTITLHKVGTCTVQANQAGNGAYNAAPHVIERFTVG